MIGMGNNMKEKNANRIQRVFESFLSANKKHHEGIILIIPFKFTCLPFLSENEYIHVYMKITFIAIINDVPAAELIFLFFLCYKSRL
jgi:hypothetical protein